MAEVKAVGSVLLAVLQVPRRSRSRWHRGRGSWLDRSSGSQVQVERAAGAEQSPASLWPSHGAEKAGEQNEATGWPLSKCALCEGVHFVSRYTQ